jgi:hypothetical protein
MLPDRNGLPERWLVTSCDTWSPFVQVTVLPTLTVMLAGLKAKFLMVTDLAATTAPAPDILGDVGIDIPGIGVAIIGVAGEAVTATRPAAAASA